VRLLLKIKGVFFLRITLDKKQVFKDSANENAVTKEVSN
jgi:hypothetical protein